MEEYEYLIIGGGMTADAAVRGIRQVDGEGRIGLVSAEPDPPYNRPPLSKDLWKGMDENRIWRQTETQDITMHLSTKIVSLNTESKTATDHEDRDYRYKKLLLATGGSPVRLPDSPEGVIYFRDYRDYRQLRQLSKEPNRFLVIGGGFIGSEIAAALTLRGRSVRMLFPEAGIGGRIFPETLSQYLNEYYQDQGVEVHSQELVKDIQSENAGYVVTTDSGSTYEADVIVAGLGIRPNTPVAREAGIAINDGIVVNELLQTSADDVYAAGDVAAFYNRDLDCRMRVEHEENANIQGMLAGVNMAGGEQRYTHLPFFYSDLFDHGYEAVGVTDSSYEIVEDWQSPHREGVIYYLEEERVRGVVLWNLQGQIDNAREIISEQRPSSSDSLKGRLPK